MQSKFKRNWKTISSKLIYKNPWIKVFEDNVIRPDGKEGIYGYLEKPTGVFIIAYNEDTNAIILEQQYRYPIKKAIYEVPAGVANTSNYLKEAKRELIEETDLRAKKWKYLGNFYVAAGHETTQIEVFLAYLKSANSSIGEQEGDEAIYNVKEYKLPVIKKMILEGKIECGITLAALNLFFLSLPNL
jgi:8-oxo-dGTP pyrophosphatase MutT (NUDIX family)